MHKNKISKVVKTSGSRIRKISILQKKEQQPWGNYRKNRIAIYRCYCSELNKLINENTTSNLAGRHRPGRGAGGLS